MGDRWGRRVACQVSCGFWIIGATIQCASQNVGMLIAGRLIAGICVGICTPLVPTYLAEISPKVSCGPLSLSETNINFYTLTHV
jgi:MFS family permease